jgi:hypothetical protein
MSDDADFYSQPENVRAGRRVASPPRSNMQGHVPVRFPQQVIDQVKAAAKEDGITVSSWIRRLVTKELERRGTSRTALTSFEPTWVKFTRDSATVVTTITTVSDAFSSVESTNEETREGLPSR